ncbi:MAG: diaminopimelate decarboxylase [Desulfobacteraceae bacterium]|nr:MAG: diaminopimelate decarboxylase [Desulfobacteraceae bacterium]
MERLRYERPTIVRHVPGLANKIGTCRQVRVKKEIDDVPIADLARQYGSPLFVFSERAIRKNFRSALRAFSTRYPSVRFAWSYKTNYLDAICLIFHQEGAWAEVVSEYEYQMARRNGVPGENIIYNGPYKPEGALRLALEEGARIHIDHYDELYTIEKIGREYGRTIDVGIRVNMDTGIYPSWDRFGFNLDTGEAMNAVRRMEAGKIVRLKGLHSHIGTFVTEPSAYRNEASKLASFVRSVEKEFGTEIEYIDMGGGFASKNTLHSQYSPGREANPTIDLYAEAITTVLLEQGFAKGRLPVLILETGRALIDEAGFLLSSIVGTKRMPSGVRTIVIDAGVNILITAFWYKHDLFLTSENEGIAEETIVCGPLCMNIDVVRPSIPLPALSAGEVLVLHPVGAYNVTQWMQFIRMRPAVILIGEEGAVDVIRNPEDLDDIKRPERVPLRLMQVGHHGE